MYMSADKSLARPGRKQANVFVRMTWISFGALSCRIRYFMTARVSILFKSRASLTYFRACFHPGRVKDISAPQYIISYRVRGSDIRCVRGYKKERSDGGRVVRPPRGKMSKGPKYKHFKFKKNSALNIKLLSQRGRGVGVNSIKCDALTFSSFNLGPFLLVKRIVSCQRLDSLFRMHGEIL